MTYDFYGVEHVPQALEYKCQKSQHLIWPLAPCIFTGTRNILTERVLRFLMSIPTVSLSNMKPGKGAGKRSNVEENLFINFSWNKVEQFNTRLK